MSHVLQYLVTIAISIFPADTTTPALTPITSAIVPALHCVYVDQREEWDIYPYENVIKVDVNKAELAGLSHLQVRVFPAKYVDAIEEPINAAIATTNSSCHVFESIVIPYDPTGTNPAIYVGRLDRSNMRCVGNELVDTDCILVVEQYGNKSSVVRIDDAHIDAYFANGYYFTVSPKKGVRCTSGTEKVDQYEAPRKPRSKKQIAIEQKHSRSNRREMAELDAKQLCINDVKSERPQRAWNPMEPAPVDMTALRDPACEPEQSQH